MKREFSIFLDLVRFLSACLVVIYHSNRRDVVESVLPMSEYGHAAVIVFFILSGYVIAYVTEQKESDPLTYSLSRMSRIYSLAIPAVLLTPLLDIVGEGMTPAFYVDTTTHDHALLRVVTSLAFLNEIWFISITSFSNVPYWSLCYEVWYYILFGIYTFVKRPIKWPLLVGVCLLLGPKILLLLPLWVLGVVLYRWKVGYEINEITGWLLFVGSIGALIAFKSLGVDASLENALKQLIGPHWHRELTFSKFFLADYVFGPIVFANLLAFRRIAHRFSTLLRVFERPIRFCAGFTFSLYILHQPLLLFFAAAIDGSPAGFGFYFAVIGAVVITVLIVGSLTESRRYWFRSRLAIGWELVATRFRAAKGI